MSEPLRRTSEAEPRISAVAELHTRWAAAPLALLAAPHTLLAALRTLPAVRPMSAVARAWAVLTTLAAVVARASAADRRSRTLHHARTVPAGTRLQAMAAGSPAVRTRTQIQTLVTADVTTGLP